MSKYYQLVASKLERDFIASPDVELVISLTPEEGEAVIEGENLSEHFLEWYEKHCYKEVSNSHFNLEAGLLTAEVYEIGRIKQGFLLSDFE